MKKLIKPMLFALIAVLAVTNLNAQDQKATFGVKGGLNVSNFTGDMNTDAKIGFNVGVTLDYAITENIFLMTGLDFSTKGSNTKESGALEDMFGDEWNEIVSEFPELSGLHGTVEETVDAMYLQVPVHLGYKFAIANNVKLVIKAGPYVAYGIAGKYKVKFNNVNIGETDTFDQVLKKLDFGVGLGTGVEFGKFGVNLGYDFGILNVSNVGDNLKARNGNFYASVGYKF